ncbi:HAMP domain-containing sensor histidine kinase [Paraglaciecola aquimarina]|uniref:histidine kinase n=1 Tax=Paraglaciecola aquimarina TaxID=1235557 RepID=A0ABU3SUY5_9ALTE|nr:HAMP domain-containing sensor histidine kinase [Paraglaciecola aquimarina]MDU0353810.1 HAMP domain-containing sensor histidine kinase [Paraglaciecola aquimarina]
MKIRPSLKLYFFISVVLLGSAMAVGFSFLSVNYYVDGLDRGVNGTMFDLAKTTIVADGQPRNIASFSVASRWQDTPEIIQQRFKQPPVEEAQLQKIKDQANIFMMPKNIFFVAYYQTEQGEPRYVSKVMLERDISSTSKMSKPTKRLIWAFVASLIAISLFAFLLNIIMQKIARPVESLKDWAKSLDQKTVQNPPPDFNYNELNVLASFIQTSLISTYQSVEREQRFLSYASHELRTPIAVIRSNVELLQRLSEKQPENLKQQQVLKRIQRAGLTMGNLTETLLWLSRNEELTIAPESVNLGEKINQACNDLQYLLDGKNVEVHIECEDADIKVVGVSCHIVLNNLIRNAYQHTQEGLIKINQQGSRLSIINTHVPEDDINSLTTPNAQPIAFGDGYGLGLQLCEKIIKHHNWFYTKQHSQGNYQVTVDFDNS